MERSVVVKYLKSGLFIALLAYVGFQIYQYIVTGDIGSIEIDPFSLTLAIVVMIISQLFPIFGWRYLINSMGANLSYSESFRVWFISNLGRYLPGKVWQIVGLVKMCEDLGVKRSISLNSMIYAQIFSLSTALFMGIVLISSDLVSPYILLFVGLLFILLLIPSSSAKIINLLLKLVKRPAVDISIRFKDLLIYLLLIVLNWLLMGFSFYLLSQSFAGFEVKSISYILILPVGWAIGLLAVFAPGGVGVRETFLAEMMKLYSTSAHITIIPWFHRVIITIIEFLLALSFYIYSKLKR